MNHHPKKTLKTDRHPLQSPHPALQAVLTGLRNVGMRNARPPFFDESQQVRTFLKNIEKDDHFNVVPVWAIDHLDLNNSKVLKWTFSRWLN